MVTALCCGCCAAAAAVVARGVVSWAVRPPWATSSTAAVAEATLPACATMEAAKSDMRALPDHVV